MCVCATNSIASFLLPLSVTNVLWNKPHMPFTSITALFYSSQHRKQSHVEKLGRGCWFDLTPLLPGFPLASYVNRLSETLQCPQHIFKKRSGKSKVSFMQRSSVFSESISYPKHWNHPLPITTILLCLLDTCLNLWLTSKTVRKMGNLTAPNEGISIQVITLLVWCAPKYWWFP